jgi:putative nucleotidyltransferase with HDIG domain
MKPTFRIAFQLLAIVALAVLTIYLFPRHNATFKYNYELGKPWGYGLVIAEYDFPVYKSEEKLNDERKMVLQNFMPVYVLDESSDHSLYVVSLSDMVRLKEQNCSRMRIVNHRDTIIVSLQKIYTPRTAYQETGRENVRPNLQYDSITSMSDHAILLKSISPTQGIVPAGAKIVDSGEMITEDIYQQLYSLQQAQEERQVSKKATIFSSIGSAICIVLLLFIFYLYLFTYRRKLLDNLRHLLFFTILMAMVVAVSYILLRVNSEQNYIYLIPFVWCPIIARVFYDSRTAIFLHIVTVSIVSVAVSASYIFLFTQLVVGIVAVISLRDMTQRAQLARTAATVLLVYSVVYTALHLLYTGSFAGLEGRVYLWFMVNAILVICAYGLIFLFERSFGLVSSITLVELTNVNSNLMLQFAEKAPGTFQHSLQVSNLATEAAKRIGAKVLLVRTGALYHDIGKMSNPDYFIENQTAGYNPLAEMDHASAARCIIDHVTEGERIARKFHLPEVIIHFIRSHHGTSQTRYFYNSALNQAKQAGLDASTVDVANYTYHGPKPSTKEAAILMMADAIEARSRSLKEMTPQTISDMVDDMIDIQMRDGQLAETPLSFKDLEDIREVFKKKLLEINHHRIVYPTVEE